MEKKPKKDSGMSPEPHVCNRCFKTFSNSSHLSRHYKIHIGSKEYNCPIPECLSKFSRRDNMKSHYKSHLSKLGLGEEEISNLLKVIPRIKKQSLGTDLESSDKSPIVITPSPLNPLIGNYHTLCNNPGCCLHGRNRFLGNYDTSRFLLNTLQSQTILPPRSLTPDPSWSFNIKSSLVVVLVQGAVEDKITIMKSVSFKVCGKKKMEIPETAGAPVKLFNQWTYDDVEVKDISLQDYMMVKQRPVYSAHTAGRYQIKRFRKSQCPVVERVANSLMMHGRNNGKKLMTTRILKHAFEIIHLLTDQNPIQILVDAIINTGPREDSTRIGSQGTVRRQAVDVSPLRRVNQAIFLLTTGAREAAFRNVKTIAECLADELINAAKGSSNSYAIKKKDELERVAKSNR